MQSVYTCSCSSNGQTDLTATLAHHTSALFKMHMCKTVFIPWPLLPNRTNGQQFNYEAHFPLIFIRRRGIITGVCSAGPLWIRLFVVGQRWRHWLESSVRSENNKFNTKQVILRAIFEGASLLNMWQKRRREFASSFLVLFLINYLFSNRTI